MKLLSCTSQGLKEEFINSLGIKSAIITIFSILIKRYVALRQLLITKLKNEVKLFSG